MIEVTPGIKIDEDELHFDFIRSAGPGGQNVNKVATAVQLRFDVRNSPALSAEIKERLVKLAGNRVTEDGVLIIEAKRTRSQEKNRLDAIDTFPEETEKPIINLVSIARPVLDIAITGPTDERTLKVIGQQVRDDMAKLPGVTQVELRNTRPYEVSIEVSDLPPALRYSVPRDGASLAALLRADPARDPGAGEVLEAYRESRRRDAGRGVAFTDFLVGAFMDERRFVSWGRGAALALLDLLPPARRWLAGRMIDGAPAP